MTRTFPHRANSVYDLRNCKTRTQVRVDTEALLRDIAFVLKMTERVRDEMEVEEEALEPAMA